MKTGFAMEAISSCPVVYDLGRYAKLFGYEACGVFFLEIEFDGLKSQFKGIRTGLLGAARPPWGALPSLCLNFTNTLPRFHRNTPFIKSNKNLHWSVTQFPPFQSLINWWLVHFQEPDESDENIEDIEAWNDSEDFKKDEEDED